MDDFDFKSVQQAVVVTGGGRGLGRAIAIEFTKQGNDITIADLDLDEMKQTQEMISDVGQSSIVVQNDLRNHTSLIENVNKALDEFESIDILVNNAGIAEPNRVCEKIPIEEWDETLAVNLRVAFLKLEKYFPS